MCETEEKSAEKEALKTGPDWPMSTYWGGKRKEGKKQAGRKIEKSQSTTSLAESVPPPIMYRARLFLH